MRRYRKGSALFVLGLIGLLIATACSSNNGGSSSPSSAPVTKGGTYRSATASFGFVGDFDPVGEYTAVGFSYYQMLLRTLLNYTGQAGAAGLVPHPDLATDMGTVSPDGLDSIALCFAGVFRARRYVRFEFVKKRKAEWQYGRGFYIYKVKQP